MTGLAQNKVRMTTDGTNMGLLKISYSTVWLGELKFTETDLKKSHICPIWGQSDPLWMQNWTSLVATHLKVSTGQVVPPGRLCVSVLCHVSVLRHVSVQCDCGQEVDLTPPG